MTTETQNLPATFGRYRLLDRVGQGGMAEVFKARLDAAAGAEKVVCIKRILPHLLQNSDFMELFVGEAKIALPLTHGNITQVFDFGEVEGVYYLAMEYVDGANLAQVMARIAESQRVLDVGATLWIAGELCRGLHYAHSQRDSSGKGTGVVHRDVSPHNVLISFNGEVKLTDFGIALAATKARPGEQVLRGKPCYVSPEQSRGAEGDPRSDVFATGAVLYEMLTGRRAFEAGDDAQTLENVRTLDVAPPSSINTLVPVAVDAIVLKALSKSPQDRYGSASAFQKALREQLRHVDPVYSSDALADLMHELFSWEIADSQGAKGASPRDRLLSQMARAGVNVSGKKATTQELLQMGTVAISDPGQSAPAASDTPASGSRVGSRWVLPVVVGLMLITGIVVAALFIGRQVDEPSPAPKDESILAQYPPPGGHPADPRVPQDSLLAYVIEDAAKNSRRAGDSKTARKS